MKIKLIKYLSILGAFIALSTTTQANTTNWTGAVNEDWATAGNWSHGLPAVNDTAAINTGTVRITSATPVSLVTNRIIDVRQASTSFYMDGINTTLNNLIFMMESSGEVTNCVLSSSNFEITRDSSVVFRNSEYQVSTFYFYTGNLTLDGSDMRITTLNLKEMPNLTLQNSSNMYLSGGISYLGNLTIVDGGSFIANGSFSATSTSTLEFYLSSAESKIVANGISLQNGSTLSLFEGDEAFVGGESFDILDFNSIVGTFTTINTSTLAEGLSWDLSELYTRGVVSIAGEVIVIPEPSTYAAIFGALALALAIYRRRK